MREYCPEAWRILYLTHPQQAAHYRIYGEFGLLRASWRLSSGADDLSELSLFMEDSLLVWPQQSGSVYRLPIGKEMSLASALQRYPFGRIAHDLAQQHYVVQHINIAELLPQLRN